MDNDRNDRRARMLDKVRKLLAMARHDNGNETEQSTAMRQANKIMAEFGIAEAECDMAAIDAGEMQFGEARCGPDGRAPAQGRVYRTMPTYAGILAVGVARFTDSVVIRKTTEAGEMLAFRGEREDVLLARWVFGVLGASILSEQARSGWTARGDANPFRVAAASTLAQRLRTLAAEREVMYRQAQAASGSRALVVVDRKATEIVKRFGAQKVRNARVGGGGSNGAYHAGSAAGSRINIPSGRPVGHTANARLT